MTSKGWQNAWHMLWLKQIKITLGEIEMKKLLAMILALGVTFSICTSCGSSSSDTEDEDSSSTVLENSDELLKSNNKVAKTLFTLVNSRYADVIVEGGEYT